MTTANMTKNCLGEDCLLDNYDFMDSFGPRLMGTGEFKRKEFKRNASELIKVGAGPSHGNNRIRLLFQLISKVLPLHEELTIKFGYNYVSTNIYGNSLEILGDSYYLNAKSYRSQAKVYTELKKRIPSL